MKQELLPAVEIEPELPATAAVIWLHGLGADGHDFVDLLPQLRLPKELAIRFIFPHAPLRPVTLNAGYTMRAWFDLGPGEQGFTVNEAHVHESNQALIHLIEHQNSLGIPSSRIVLAGFSQGGAIALFCGLHYSVRLAGLLALSTFLPTSAETVREFSPANSDVPIMLAHGTADPLISLASAQLTRDTLVKLNYPVSWHTYPMPHSVCPEEIRDISVWLQKVLS